MTRTGAPAEPFRGSAPDPRLDRQLRIPGWDQKALDEARILLLGDDDLLASLYVLSAAALGLNDIVLLAPGWDRRLVEMARQVNPRLGLALLEGIYTHPLLDEILPPATVIVDLTRYALANKLLLERASRTGLPVVRGFCRQEGGLEGLTVFAYRKGREWQELWELVSPSNLPGSHFDDGALDLVAAGVALEETRNVLMERRISGDAIAYERPRPEARWADARVAVIGAGALGNFVGLGLAFAGVRSVTVMDPDEVDVTNLNRQVLLAGGIGRPKAEVLSERLQSLFGVHTDARVASFSKDSDLSGFDAVFDCVDNFETRLVLSESCREKGKVLISGGTGPEAGQIVVFDPGRSEETPAELLGLREIVAGRAGEAAGGDSASCTVRPEPSVVMTNQIVGGLMVDAFRILRGGGEPGNVFYDSRSDGRIFT